MAERWKDIKGYEGLYRISDTGRVWSCVTNKEMRTYIMEGYYRVGLTKNGVKRNWRLHQLLYLTFIGDYDYSKKEVIDHIDGNPLNNSLDNFRILSNYENMRRGRKPRKPILPSCITALPDGTYRLSIDGTKEQIFKKFSRAFAAMKDYEKAQESGEEIQTHKLRHSARDGYKICPICHESKPISEYEMYKGHFKTGKCKDCTKEYMRYFLRRRREEQRIEFGKIRG